MKTAEEKFDDWRDRAECKHHILIKVEGSESWYKCDNCDKGFIAEGMK